MVRAWRFCVRQIFAIRSRFVIASSLLAVVPIIALVFARFYESELLRSEEEALVAFAGTVQSFADADVDRHGDSVLQGDLLHAMVLLAAPQMHGQLRILDGQCRTLADSGPETLTLVTSGRHLLEPIGEDSRSPSVLSMHDSADANALCRRAEIQRAFAGDIGRAARKPVVGRGVRLFIAAPIHAQNKSIVGVVYASRSTYPVLVSMYRVRARLWMLAWLSLFAALVMGTFLAFTISRPLHRLTRAAKRITAGEKGVTIDTRGQDEVGELSRAFDTMARDLDARLHYVSELAANISHEFKTPLASIRGAAELLAEGAVDDEATRARFLDNILSDTERMARLVSRLLELARLEAKPEVPVDFDLHALLSNVVAESSERVRLDWRATRRSILGRPRMLESAVQNLVDNATRFSDADSEVCVRVSDPVAGDIRIEVIDRGQGISEANLARVWQRFFTTDRARGGTGLGMAIVRAAVDAHGGRVNLESKWGEGTTVTLDLPA
jgi:two-component system sensor histidine kinase ChvG